MQDKPVLSSWQGLLDYLAIYMAHPTVERVRVLYLGADVPVQDLVRLAENGEIDAVCLSGGREADWASLPRLVADLARIRRPVRIYLGGGAAADHPAPPGVTVLTGNLREAAATIASGDRR